MSAFKNYTLTSTKVTITLFLPCLYGPLSQLVILEAAIFFLLCVGVEVGGGSYLCANIPYLYWILTSSIDYCFSSKRIYVYMIFGQLLHNELNSF